MVLPKCPTPCAYSECSTRMSYFQCPISYKRALLVIGNIHSPAQKKDAIKL